MKGLAIASVGFGILGILLCWFGIGIVLAFLALIFGFSACFNRTARGMAMMGLLLGIIGMIISGAVVYGLVYVARHPQIVWQTGQESLEDFMEKGKLLEQYPQEVIESAADNANVPHMLILINPRSYMELLINELSNYPEKYSVL